MNRRDFLGRIGLSAGSLLILQSGCAIKSEAASLARSAAAASAGKATVDGFASPPFDCGPWVYWFWLDVNVTREGITADLEAMKKVGIAGVLIMDVDQGTPASFTGAKFGDETWYDLLGFACQEAHRLGIQVNLTNDAGWCGSGGPWIPPELSMQIVVWSEARVSGGKPVELPLPRPKANLDFYRDIAVLAFPTPTAEKEGQGYRIPDITRLSDTTQCIYNVPTRADWPSIPADQTVPRPSVLDLTEHMDEHSVLRCELPEGGWTIIRFGHTTMAAQNHPAPAGGLGLETDKLSRKATLFQFEALIERVIKTIGPLAGKALVATHIDSWETGSQNWTPTMQEDFMRLRGYDVLPFLPVLTGRVVDSMEISQRFLWDFRQTIGDLLVENYAGTMREAAQRYGLRLTIEAYYGEPADDVSYGCEAVEPMTEIWSWDRYGERGSVTEMASAGHVSGRNIIGQETFTAGSNEKWLGYPAVVKDIGDWTLCEGINRFVFHRYAMQPWTSPHHGPGMSMGPWGMHYERTQTWWNMSKPWHDYVARCCYMLRQGNFVADVCYVEAEGAPRLFSPPDNSPQPSSVSSDYPFPPEIGAVHPPRRPGFNYDCCPANLVIDRMEFKDGFLTLPGGMKYRVLVLPESPTMTPQLLRKVNALVEAGALVIGARPEKSPSLAGFPHCDDEVQRLSAELWDSGKIISQKSPADVLTERGIKPDFTCDQPLVRWIHRRAHDMEIYFVANGAADDEYPYAGWPMIAYCSFRVIGAAPEIWDPETGRISPVVVYETSDGLTRLPIFLQAKGAAFIVFRKAHASSLPPTVRCISRNGETLLAVESNQPSSRIEILSADYGKIGKSSHLHDVKADIQNLVDSGQTSFSVSRIAAIYGRSSDAAINALDIKSRVNSVEKHTLYHEGDTVDFSVPSQVQPVSFDLGSDGGTRICVSEPGDYVCTMASGGTRTLSVAAIPKPLTIEGPWLVRFPPGWGAPFEIHLDTLIPLNKHSDAGVRYFSGTASYSCRFGVPAELLAHDRRIELDLGKVAVMADVRLNGQHLGILWKPPYRVDVTRVLRVKGNTLEIAVANLWINRMIGDQQLPSDADRNSNGSLKRWPQWLLDGKTSPTGRFTFTTWELWHKNDALVDSGLIGPVRLFTTICKAMSRLQV